MRYKTISHPYINPSIETPLRQKTESALTVRESREELMKELSLKQKKLSTANCEEKNLEILRDIEDVRQSLIRMKLAEERLF